MNVTEEMVDVAVRIAFPLNSMANPVNERIRAKVRDALTAAIALMRGQSEVPYGMVLMPIDPTPEMLARYEHVRSGGDWQPTVFRLTKRQLARHRKAYAAMLPPPKKDTADEQ